MSDTPAPVREAAGAPAAALVSSLMLGTEDADLKNQQVDHILSQMQDTVPPRHTPLPPSLTHSYLACTHSRLPHCPQRLTSKCHPNAFCLAVDHDAPSGTPELDADLPQRIFARIYEPQRLGRVESRRTRALRKRPVASVQNATHAAQGGAAAQQGASPIL